MKITARELIEEIERNEYIENKEVVISILSKVNLNLLFDEFKKGAYYYKLKINDESIKYFENSGNSCLTTENKASKIINAIWCILTDNFYKDYTPTELLDELGYESLKKANKILSDINKNNHKLHNVFSTNDIELLTENIQL